MKYFVAILLLLSLSSNAQESKSFNVDRKIKQSLTFDLNALKAYKTAPLDSIVIYNHLMQRKSSIKNIRGVPLKELLASVEITDGLSKTTTLLCKLAL